MLSQDKFRTIPVDCVGAGCVGQAVLEQAAFRVGTTCVTKC